MNNLTFYIVFIISILGFLLFAKIILKFISKLIQIGLSLFAIVALFLFITNYTGCGLETNNSRDKEKPLLEEKGISYSQKKGEEFSMSD